MPKYPGRKLRPDRFLYHEMPKMVKNLPCNLHGWAFYKITNTYHKFCHKCLVSLKSKSPNGKGPQPISYKSNFSQKESIHLIGVILNIIYVTYLNNQGKIQARPRMSLNDTRFSQQLTVWVFSLMDLPDIMLVLIKIINHLYFY